MAKGVRKREAVPGLPAYLHCACRWGVSRQGVRYIFFFHFFSFFGSRGCWKLLPVPKAFEKLITMYGFHNKSSTGNKELCKEQKKKEKAERRRTGRSKFQLQTDKWTLPPGDAFIMLRQLHMLHTHTASWAIPYNALHMNRNSWW